MELEDFDVNAERQENYNYAEPAQGKEANSLLSSPSMPGTCTASMIACMPKREVKIRLSSRVLFKNIESATVAYLNEILTGKLTFPSEEADKVEAQKNVFLATVIAKCRAYLHKKHTYSTLSRTNGQSKRGRFAEQ